LAALPILAGAWPLAEMLIELVNANAMTVAPARMESNLTMLFLEVLEVRSQVYAQA
jgi:hypothetical protein